MGENVCPAEAIVQYFEVKLVELNFLTNEDIRELAPLCAKALGLQLVGQSNDQSDAAEESSLAS